MVKLTLSILFLLSISSSTVGQVSGIKWFSETNNNGIVIQNSFPKGGPYKGPVKENFNHSYLVFFTRVINKTEKSIKLNIQFSADSFPIPNSPNTFVKLFLPPNEMTLEKQSLFSYGLTELNSLNEESHFQKTIKSNEEALFYVVAVFYQINADAWNEERGGNRAELILQGEDLFYNLSPQINSLPCGQIISIQ